ncbi:MAG: hypothetical protein ACE15D_03100 [Candidatus Eisenbacteria bacterium]|nr:hypothetical protein [Candidatus Eisenbacteria bacterium]
MRLLFVLSALVLLLQSPAPAQDEDGRPDGPPPLATLDPDDPLRELLYVDAGVGVISNLGSGDLRQVTMVTSDSVSSILAFYEKQLGEHLSANCMHGGNGKMTVSCNDSRRLQEAGIEARVLTQVTRDHLVTITITRAAEEDSTHLVLTYWRR